jgi:hypothetical protein
MLDNSLEIIPDVAAFALSSRLVGLMYGELPWTV